MLKTVSGRTIIHPWILHYFYFRLATVGSVYNKLWTHKATTTASPKTDHCGPLLSNEITY